MTGIITSLPPPVEPPPGNSSGNPVGLPGYTFTIALLGFPQTWTAKQTFPLGNISLNAADIIGLSPSSTIDTTNSANINFIQSGTGAVTRTVSNKLKETFSVTDFGALGTSNDSATFIAAIAAASAAGGGIVNVPVGLFTVRGLTLPDGVTLQGAGKNATYLTTKSVDSTIITISGTKAGIADMVLIGKGTNNDTGSFGSSNPTLNVTAVESNIRRVLILGGQYGIAAPGTDNMFEDVNSSDAFGNANVSIVGGANWFVRCKFDHTTQGVTLTDTAPFNTNWASGTPYTVGQVRIVSGYLLVCSVGGTSGGVAPTLKNYLVNIVDNTVTWLLLAPATYSGLLVGAGSGESHLTQVDLSGPYSTSLLVQATAGSNGPGVVNISNSIFSSPVQITNGTLVTLLANELGASITVDTAYTGKVIIDGNSSVGNTINVTVGANVNNFAIINNFFSGGTITVTAGTSDNYVIDNNPNATVSDSGTGVHKVVGTYAGQTYGGAATIQASSLTLRGAGGGASDIRLGVAGSTNGTLTVAGGASGSQVWQAAGAASGTITWPAGTVNFPATGGASQVVKQTSAGGIFTVGQLAFSDISGTATNGQLVNSSVTIAGQSIALGASGGLSALNNSLGSPVTMTTQNTYYDGPSVAQGTTGTWYASGTITVAANGANNIIVFKLWDGTNLIDSAVLQAGTGLSVTAHLSGYLASPVGNLRLSASNVSASGGTIATANGVDQKASTISTFRIA